MANKDFIGNKDAIACCYKGLTKCLKPGSIIYIADGNLTCIV